MTRRTAEPGQPLMMLVLVLGGWIVLRAIVWQTPFAAALSPAGTAEPLFASLSSPPQTRARELPQRSAAYAPPQTWQATHPVAMDAQAFLPLANAPARPLPVEPVIVPLLAPPPTRFDPVPPRVAAGHSLMLMAGFANLELPPEIARLFAPGAPRAPAAVPFQPALAMAGTSSTDRWSADAWLLLRKDTTTAVTSGRGSYGQSQLGAVLRYRLRPASGHRPTFYLRASQALGGARETEAAFGFAARPVPGIPIVAAGELRFTHADGRTHTRPAAYAVTELPPFALPGGFTGEAYLQGGYVGGDFATGFVDGQIRAERKLFDLGRAELRAGGGAWGGAQKGASRLDIGPSATVKLTIGDTPARASMDWRFRVAGTAEPRSGPALTISAGF